MAAPGAAFSSGASRTLVPTDHGGAQRLPHPAQVLLRLAVAVDGRGVEVVDAELQRPGHRPLLVGGGAATMSPPTAPQPNPSTATSTPVLPSMRLSMIGSLEVVGMDASL